MQKGKCPGSFRFSEYRPYVSQTFWPGTDIQSAGFLDEYPQIYRSKFDCS
jgi:hypothetical protein